MPVLWCPRHQFGSGSQILPGASLDDHTSCTCCTLVTPNREALYPGPLLICGLMWLDCVGIFSMTKALMPLTGPHIPYNARLTLILNPPHKGLMILISAIAASFLFSKTSFISLSFFESMVKLHIIKFHQHSPKYCETVLWAHTHWCTKKQSVFLRERILSSDLVYASLLFVKTTERKMSEKQKNISFPANFFLVGRL